MSEITVILLVMAACIYVFHSDILQNNAFFGTNKHAFLGDSSLMIYQLS